MMKRLLLFSALFCLAFSAVAGDDFSTKTQTLLQELDKVVERKDYYLQQREQRASKLKQVLRKVPDAQRAPIYRRLFEIYLHTQADSANLYLQRLEQTPQAHTDPSLRAYVLLGRAELLALMGLYPAALETADKAAALHLTGDDLLHYYRIKRTVYGWMKDFAAETASGGSPAKLTAAYRDSILSLEPSGHGRNIVLIDKLLSEGKVKEASQLAKAEYQRRKGKLDVFTVFNLAECYRLSDDYDQAAYYLAETALMDLKAGIKEYEALPLLAELLFQRGDLTRAYNYLICTIQDASYCKARLRSVEASKIFPLIDHAYKEKSQEWIRIERIFFAGVSLLALLLFIVVFYLRRQMKKLSQTRMALAKTNKQLLETNAHLQMTDKMKEAYIVRYLDRCRDYIEAIGGYRRSLLKLAKAGNMQEVANRLRSDIWEESEQERFYADFDEAFLNLFPNFIEDFNALLLPEAQIYPKNDELLNTELRVFALIRLGVKESKRIAHFLNYSLATIYNYRSKYRNKSVLSKTDFEQRVQQL